MQRQLTEEVMETLQKAGFSTFVPLEKKSCFEIAARQGDRILLIKVLSNIDALRESQAGELLALANNLGATPLLIGEKSKSYGLENSLVYERYGISTLNLHTFFDVLVYGKVPEKKYYKGRVVAQLDATAIEKGMEKLNITVQEIANYLKVSRESVYNYRKGGQIEFAKAEKLQNYLETNVIKDVQLFTAPEASAPGKLQGYLQEMSELGFDIVPVHRGFDAIARERDALLVDKEMRPEYARRKAHFMQSASQFFETHPAFVIDKRQVCESIKGVPVIKREELKSAESAGEVLDLVKKREKK